MADGEETVVVQPPVVAADRERDALRQLAGARASLCGCPTNLADRKAAAQARRGPMPEVRIGFRTTDLPELGMFSFVSTSWELAAELPALAAALDVAAVPALGVLRCELVEFITRSELAVSYRRPVVEIGGTQVLAQDAVYDSRRDVGPSAGGVVRVRLRV